MSSQSQVNVRASPRLRSQDGVSQQEEADPLSLPQLNRHFESSLARDESSASNVGVVVIPSQFKVTQQILLHWQPSRDLKLKFVGSRRAEQLNFLSQQHIVSTVEDSVLRMEMAGLESQEEDAPKRVLFFKPMSAQIPVIPERPLTACGCRKFQIDALGDHLCTCTAHSGAKKTHDWAVDQLADLFRRTTKVKSQQVANSRSTASFLGEAVEVQSARD